MVKTIAMYLKAEAEAAHENEPLCLVVTVDDGPG